MSKADSVAIWTYEVARRLAAHHEVVVYGRRFPGQPGDEVHEQVRYRRIELDRPLTRVQHLVHRAGVKPVGRGSGLFEIGYALRLAEELAEEAYDVVHVHNLSQYASLFRPVLPKSALVLHMHCEWLSQIARRTAHARLHKVDRILGCSEYVRDRLAERFPEMVSKAGVVHNGVDLEAFGPLEPSPAPPKDGGTVLFVGRISPEKGVHDLVDAFGRLLKSRPRAELRLVGPHEPTPRQYIVELADDPAVRSLARFYPGNYLEELQSRMDGELRARVHFVGEVEHHDLATEYERADVLVNPSLSEAFGMSLVEAMAAGVPVVATWVGGMSHVLEEGKCGLLVPPASPPALERAISRVLQDDELRAALVERGRRSAGERYTWPRVTERASSEYERTLEGP